MCACASYEIERDMHAHTSNFPEVVFVGYNLFYNKLAEVLACKTENVTRTVLASVFFVFCFSSNEDLYQNKRLRFITEDFSLLRNQQ